MQDQSGRRRSSLSILVPGALEQNAHDRIRQLPISTVRPNPFQVRVEFSEDSIQELAQSINENGLLEPVVVRPIIGSDGKPSDVMSYELVAGERRWRAFKLLKKSTIPAIVRPTKDEDMKILALLENVQREDLSILEKANAVKDLKLKLGSVEAVSERLGWSRRTGFTYARLGDADPLYQDVILKNHLDIKRAEALLSTVDKLKKSGDKKALDDFHKNLLSNSFSPNDLLGSAEAKDRAAEGGKQKGLEAKPLKKGFWTNANEFGLSIKLKKGKSLERKDQDSVVTYLTRFCKEMGAKKIDIRF